VLLLAVLMWFSPLEYYIGNLHARAVQDKAKKNGKNRGEYIAPPRRTS